MRHSLFVKRVLPLFSGYVLLVASAIALDFVLHRANLSWIGRYFGILGTAFIICSFAYSMRKRKILQVGSPKTLLDVHEYLSWAGVLLILVHAGVHFNAVLPWLAIVLMLVVVASGFTGKFLLKEAREKLRWRQEALRQQGIGMEEIEKRLFLDSISVDLMKNWRAFHIPITTIFATLAILHILAILLFWRW
ncbi:MAG: hypothetical protein AB1757_24180 [Acidobacteriota bacterium]